MAEPVPVLRTEPASASGLACADGAGLLEGDGTPEELWLPWLEGVRLPDMLWPVTGTLVVLAPHPDDEVLGLGGVMHDLSALGWNVEIITVTDGEASHPGSTRHTRAALGELRRSELQAALAVLGAGTRVHHLGLPDGAVTPQHDRLRDAIGAVVAATPAGPVILAHPHPDDGHPDHDAAGRAALAVEADMGICCIAYPVWLWHHRQPPLSLDGVRIHRLHATTQQAKAAAMDCFASQIHPLGDDPADAAILPHGILRRFQRPFEVVFT